MSNRIQFFLGECNYNVLILDFFEIKIINKIFLKRDKNFKR